MTKVLIHVKTLSGSANSVLFACPAVKAVIRLTPVLTVSVQNCLTNSSKQLNDRSAAYGTAGSSEHACVLVSGQYTLGNLTAK